MSKILVIARKDIREAFHSRSIYIYIGLLLILTLTYFSAYNSLIERVTALNPGTETVYQASRSFINSIISTLPLMYGILICSLFAAYSVIVDKAKRNIESLMVTPISLNQLWIGKTLAVTAPSVLIALGVTILGYLAINFTQIIARTNSFIIPDALAVVTALVLIPALIFAVVSLVVYLQLVIANPRIANLAFTGIFLLLFFGVNFMAQMGLEIEFSLIYACLIVLCGGLSYLLSRSLTKERVLLSSKG